MKKSILNLAGTMIMTGAFLSATTVYGSNDSDENTAKHTAEHRDRLACYKWDKYPDERFKLNIKYHSPLSERVEEQKFKHAKQTSYSVHGKHVLFDYMATVEGTVVTASSSSGGSPGGGGTKVTGAHMGLHAKWVRGEDYRPVTLDCTTDEVSSAPKTWYCESRNDYDEYHGYSTLTWVDETQDSKCSIFEDSKKTIQSPSRQEHSGSMTRQ